jgi:PIN domain nuclease of toxin-antitoxin system
VIVLDTHIWLWWVNQDAGLLRPHWIARLEAEDEVGVSAISCFEVAWLERHRRIALPCPREEWLEKALSGSGVELLPLTPAIASRAVDLAEHHRDPQDRIIIATALAHGAELLSIDARFAAYEELGEHLLR